MQNRFAVAGLIVTTAMAGCATPKWRNYPADRAGAEKAIAMLKAQPGTSSSIEFSYVTGTVNLYTVTQVDDDRICGGPAGAAENAVACYSYASITHGFRVWDGKGNLVDAVVDTVTLPVRAVGAITP